MEPFLYFAALLVGWWLPAVIYYLCGLFLLMAFARTRVFAVIWLVSFLALLGYSTYEGIFLKSRLDQRAETYRQYVKYADVPSDVTTIVLTRSQEDDSLTGHAQSCSTVCTKLLLDGRFKTVVIAVKDRSLFHYKRRNLQAIERSYPPQSYDVFTVVDEQGCENYKYPDFYEVAEAWRLFGRCIHKTTLKRIEGRYLEVTTNEDMPDQPPWRLRFSTHVRVADAGKFTDIARVEYASVNLATWFPVPGFFPHGSESGLPTKFWPDLLRHEHHYGPFKNSISVIEEATGVRLAGPIPLPRFEDQTPEGRLLLARQILLRGPMHDRYRFTKNELAGQRPFNQDYRDLILEFIARTKFSGEGYYQMIPYIAWLAAGDPGFAPVIAKMYVERAGDSPNSARYAQSLSYFEPNVLAPYASQLLALYERKFAKPQDAEHFRVSLTLGLGRAGPAVIDTLIEKLSDPDPLVAASAAVALCRAGDPRAVAPLLEKIRTPRLARPMSYAYALARLGHGQESRDAIAPVRGPQSSEFSCLNEIVNRYPTGDTPPSTCLLEGPHTQAQGAEWQFSESQLRYLAPRTPSPNG